MSSDLNAFLADKTLLVTGGSGFVGKCLVHRILSLAPDVRAVILLLRPKAGKTAEKRAQELIRDPMFAGVSDRLERVSAVSGDVTVDELALSAADRLLLRDCVHVVFNCAATIRFDEPLRRALQLNVLSAQRVVRLVEGFARIEALVHVSTAYCTRRKSDVTESVESEAVSAERLLDASEWLDEASLEACVRKQLFGERHSTYHFTKALAESVVAMATVPTAIVRPSIIGAALKDPSPGWVDNYNGVSGFLVAAGKGVLRSLHARHSAVCDVIPVDLVANTCVAAAALVAAGGAAGGPLVVNCVSGADNPMTWRQLVDMATPLLVDNPSREMFRFPHVSLHSSAFVHKMHVLVEHSLPAKAVDFLFRLCGLTPILGKVYQKVNKSLFALQYFTCNEWRFRTQNQRHLSDWLSAQDRRNAPTDPRLLDWPKYLENYVRGVRRHLLRESDQTLEVSRRRLRRLEIWTKIVKTFLLLMAFYKTVSILRQMKSRFSPQEKTA